MFYIFRVLIFEILLSPEKALPEMKISEKTKRTMKLLGGYLTHLICLDFNNTLKILPDNTEVISLDERITEPSPERAIYGTLIVTRTAEARN